MLDKFLYLLERFVAAHELIAAKKPSLGTKEELAEFCKWQGLSLKEAVAKMGMDPAEHKEDINAQAVKKAVAETGRKPEPKKPVKAEEPKKVEMPEPEDAPEDEPKRKPRQAKPKSEAEPDLDKLREEIEVMAKHIGSGDSDDCADELDDLLDAYDARSVKKLKDLQVQEFHKELKAIVAKYYDIIEE